MADGRRADHRRDRPGSGRGASAPGHGPGSLPCRVPRDQRGRAKWQRHRRRTARPRSDCAACPRAGKDRGRDEDDAVVPVAGCGRSAGAWDCPRVEPERRSEVAPGSEAPIRLRRRGDAQGRAEGRQRVEGRRMQGAVVARGHLTGARAGQRPPGHARCLPVRRAGAAREAPAVAAGGGEGAEPEDQRDLRHGVEADGRAELALRLSGRSERAAPGAGQLLGVRRLRVPGRARRTGRHRTEDRRGVLCALPGRTPHPVHVPGRPVRLVELPPWG